MTVAGSTALLMTARGRSTAAARAADLEAAFGQASPLHQHVLHLVPTRGALDRLFTRAQRLGRR